MIDNRIKQAVLAVALAATAAGIYFYTTRTPKVEAHMDADPSKVQIEEAPDGSTVQVERPQDFSLAEVANRPVQDQLSVTGSITPDVSRTVPVVSLAGGRVTDVRARLGDRVAKGQHLLTISSPDLAAAFADHQKFVTDEALARKQLDRAELLYSRGAIAQKDVQLAEDAEAKARVDLSTSAERIRILGGDIHHPGSTIDVLAPVSGVIVEQNVTGSAAVKSLDNSPNLFTIADLSRVWMLCDVYENDIAGIRIGQAADVHLNAFPDRVLHGRISNIGQVLDPATRTAKVRVELANTGGLLRPNMFGTVTLLAPRATRPTVPAAAVLHLHDRNWVFIPAGNRFRRQEVQVGAMLLDHTQEVLGGVAPGDRVVANALALTSAADAHQ